jgi:hypothetical protein
MMSDLISVVLLIFVTKCIQLYTTLYTIVYVFKRHGETPDNGVGHKILNKISLRALNPKWRGSNETEFGRQWIQNC